METDLICKYCLRPVEENEHHLLLYRCGHCFMDFGVDLDKARSPDSVFIKIYCPYCGKVIDTGKN
jgi:hypothetical protein